MSKNLLKINVCYISRSCAALSITMLVSAAITTDLEQKEVLLRKALILAPITVTYSCIKEFDK